MKIFIINVYYIKINIQLQKNVNGMILIYRKVLRVKTLIVNLYTYIKKKNCKL